MRPFLAWFRRVSQSDPRRGPLAESVSWIGTLITLLFAWTTLLQAYVIPSGSMENTLLVGDHLIVDRLVYSPTDSITRHLLPYRDVERGDVIIFRHPLEKNTTLVKRAIGLPGDHIRLLHKQLILNGKAREEPYAHHIAPEEDPYRDDFPFNPPPNLRPRALEMLTADVVNGELVVPPGYIFAMGDNRENSDDSRYWGLVPRENIEGTPVMIYWSFEAPEEDLTNPNIGFDHVMDIVTHFFSKTRWTRTFLLIRHYPLGT